MRGDVTDAWRQTITEDRATQPMEAGGWVSQFEFVGGNSSGVLDKNGKIWFQMFFFHLAVWKCKYVLHGWEVVVEYIPGNVTKYIPGKWNKVYS